MQPVKSLQALIGNPSVDSYLPLTRLWLSVLLWHMDTMPLRLMKLSHFWCRPSLMLLLLGSQLTCQVKQHLFYVHPLDHFILVTSGMHCALGKAVCMSAG